MPATWHPIQPTKLLSHQGIFVQPRRILPSRIPAKTWKVSGWQSISEAIASLIMPLRIVTRLLLANASQCWAIGMTGTVCSPFLAGFQWILKPEDHVWRDFLSDIRAGSSSESLGFLSLDTDGRSSSLQVLLSIAVYEIRYSLGRFYFDWVLSSLVSWYCGNGRCLLFLYHSFFPSDRPSLTTVEIGTSLATRVDNTSSNDCEGCSWSSSSASTLSRSCERMCEVAMCTNRQRPR